MSKKRNPLHAHTYFIFRLNEHLKNAYHALQNNRCDSLRSMLNECIVIQDEINKNPGDNERLKKGLKSQYESLKFWYKENPLYEHHALRKPISLLIEKINADQDPVELYNSISSLLKTVRRINLVSLHIDVLRTLENISFKQVDIILDSLISELVFEGYSLRYLREWYSEHIFKSDEIWNLNEFNVLTLLGKIEQITRERQRYSILINCWVPADVSSPQTNIVINERYQIHLVEHKTIGINDLEKHFTFKQEFNAVIVRVRALDKYKAIELAKGYVEGYLEVYKQLHRKPNIVVGNISYVSNDENHWDKIRYDVEADRLISSIDEREKEDIQNFIQLRDRIYCERIDAPDIHILERALFIINRSSELSSENKLLNLWSALEYLLASYHKGSIIGKVIDIVPKVICLYFVKDKMNVLWERFLKLRGQKIDGDLTAELNKLFDVCGDKSREGKYIKEAFAKYLSSQSAEQLHLLLQNKSVPQRVMCDLHEIFTNAATLLSSLEYTSNSIIHDLARIYRVRNKLVHSGSHIPENLDVYTGKLFRYINCLVGTLIYYSNKTPELTIHEILSSIVQTHHSYLETIKENHTDLNKALKEVITPSYLFL